MEGPPTSGSPQGYVSVNPKTLLEKQRPKVSSSFVIKLIGGGANGFILGLDPILSTYIRRPSFNKCKIGLGPVCNNVLGLYIGPTVIYLHAVY